MAGIGEGRGPVNSALGRIMQRPEAHCLPHERDFERRKFGYLPMRAILCRTFANPENVVVDLAAWQ